MIEFMRCTLKNNKLTGFLFIALSNVPIAKGLEGHLKSHQEIKQEVDEPSNLNDTDRTEEEFQNASYCSYNDEKESCYINGNLNVWL